MTSRSQADIKLPLISAVGTDLDFFFGVWDLRLLHSVRVDCKPETCASPEPSTQSFRCSAFTSQPTMALIARSTRSTPDVSFRWACVKGRQSAAPSSSKPLCLPQRIAHIHFVCVCLLLSLPLRWLVPPPLSLLLHMPLWRPADCLLAYLPTCLLLLPRHRSFDTSASPCCAAAAAATTMFVDAPAPPGCAAASKGCHCLVSTPALLLLSISMQHASPLT